MGHLFSLKRLLYLKADHVKGLMVQKKKNMKKTFYLQYECPAYLNQLYSVVYVSVFCHNTISFPLGYSNVPESSPDSKRGSSPGRPSQIPVYSGLRRLVVPRYPIVVV